MTAKALEKKAAAITPAGEISDIYESLVIKGDLSGLSPADKARYYNTLCERLGLDPTTQPFALLTLSGRQVLYPQRGATDQLARIHGLTRTIIKEETIGDAYIVTVEAQTPDGRREVSKGAVSLANLKGEGYCNAIMKAETKAKRRATLSILGLGLLDETEVETIPKAATAPANPPPPVDPVIAELRSNVVEVCRRLNLVSTVKWSPAKIFETYQVDLSTAGEGDLRVVLDDLAEQLAIQEDAAGTPEQTAETAEVAA